MSKVKSFLVVIAGILAVALGDVSRPVSAAETCDTVTVKQWLQQTDPSFKDREIDGNDVQIILNGLEELGSPYPFEEKPEKIVATIHNDPGFPIVQLTFFKEDCGRTQATIARQMWDELSKKLGENL